MISKVPIIHYIFGLYLCHYTSAFKHSMTSSNYGMTTKLAEDLTKFHKDKIIGRETLNDVMYMVCYLLFYSFSRKITKIKKKFNHE